MGKEALDDYQRYLRDKESNSTRYLILDRSVSDVEDGLLTRSVPSAKLKVGDMVCLEKNMRVPADMVLLRTSEGPSGTGEPDSTLKDSKDLLQHEESGAPVKGDEADDGGSCFVRTDQLDGETDWKLKIGKDEGKLIRSVGQSSWFSSRFVAQIRLSVFQLTHRSRISIRSSGISLLVPP
jgi:phospholipid-translocating ATPase